MSAKRRGPPPRSGGGGTVAIQDPRVTDAELLRVGAFRQLRRRYDKNNQPIDGDEYEAIMLSLYFDSGHIQRDADEEPVLDSDGEEQAHLINDGFVALTAGNKGKLAGILKALGFRDSRFYDDKGMTREAWDSMEFEFGWLGKADYSNVDYSELPFYPGRGPRAEFEVPVVSWKIMGYEVIGRKCDISLTIDDSGYNKVDNYMVSAGFRSLDGDSGKKRKPHNAEDLSDEAQPKSRPSKGKGKDRIESEVDHTLPGGDEPDPYNDATPFDDEPSTSRAKYTDKAMKAAGVMPADRIRLVGYMIEDDEFDSIADISIDDAKTLKARIESGENAVQVIKDAYRAFRDGKRPPWEEGEEEDEDDEFDEDVAF